MLKNACRGRRKKYSTCIERKYNLKEKRGEVKEIIF